MDLPAFAASLLSRADSLLPEWFPAGKWVGKEFTIGDISGEPGQSLSVNSVSGIWADFADPSIKGGDLLALYAAKRGLKMGEAAKELGWENGVKKPPEKPCEPIPDDPPPLPGTVPSALYKYGSAFWVARYETEAGKTFKPWTWRAGRWYAKAYPAPRPLYGLELLAGNERPVLIVEGEKCCDAARTVLGKGYNILTWAGGANGVAGTDWSPLFGRQVDLWPDADEPGNKAVAAILERLAPHIIKRVRILEQTGQPEGWDIADAVEAGWKIPELAAHIGREGGKYVKTIEAVELKRGRHHDGQVPVKHIEAVTETGERSMRSWHEELKLDSNERGPYETEANAVRILAGHPQFMGRIWLDSFANILMYGELPMDEAQMIATLIYFQQHLGFRKISMTAIERAALHVGNMNQRNPVRNWLDGLQWDGTARLDTFMSDAFGAKQNEYTAAVGRCWLISMVARAYVPGCQVDTLVVLEGPQGAYKSSACRALVPEPWFSESHEDPIHNRKDFLAQLKQYWSVEIPELHTIAGRGNGIEKIKGIISCRSDIYRVPYGRSTKEYPRQTVFVGTTNSDAWNPDSTGGRRFWPITVGTISIDYIKGAREQLFAEAVRLYRQGVLWYDVPELAAREEQDARRETDAWENKIQDYLKHRDGTSVDDVLENCLQVKAADWQQYMQTRVGKALRVLGWIKYRGTVHEGRRWLYRRSAAIQKSLGITPEEF